MNNAIKRSNVQTFGSDAFGFWESAGLYRPEPIMSRAGEEVKYSSAERELLLRTLSVLEKKCEDVNRTAEELETLERTSNLFLGSLALSKTQREYLDFLKRRRNAVEKSLEELRAAKDASGSCGNRRPDNVKNLKQAMANRPENVDAIWDVCTGSRFDEDNLIETEREQRWLYMDTFWLCTRLIQLEKVTDCMGSDSPRVFKKALRDGRDYVWILVSGKRPSRNERGRDLVGPRDNCASSEEEFTSSV